MLRQAASICARPAPGDQQARGLGRCVCLRADSQGAKRLDRALREPVAANRWFEAASACGAQQDHRAETPPWLSAAVLPRPAPLIRRVRAAPRAACRPHPPLTGCCREGVGAARPEAFTPASAGPPLVSDLQPLLSSSELRSVPRLRKARRRSSAQPLGKRSAFSTCPAAPTTRTS